MLRRAFCGFLLVLGSAAAYAESGFYLRNGDTVVFYGDSITDQRLYTAFVETFVVTRFPAMNVRFVHSGWGGDRVTGGAGGPVDERLRRDVIAYKPTVMTIMLGMNDGRYREFDDSIFRDFANGYHSIVQTVKRALPAVRITAIRPSPFDDVTRAPNFPGGYNAVLVRYGDFIKELAAKENLLLADMNSSVAESLRKASNADSGVAVKIIPDRIHPAAGGHLLMAQALLEAWGAEPTVTAVTIDAASGEVKRNVNTTVTGVETRNGLSWKQTDSALPMPVDWKDPVAALAVRSSDFIDKLNQQTLRLTGLAAGTFNLRINGTSVGEFSDSQLASGINLGAMDTPMARQAAGVHALTVKRVGLHQVRWRSLQMPYQNENYPRLDTILENLDAMDAEIAIRQRAAAQPSTFFYELIPRP